VPPPSCPHLLPHVGRGCGCHPPASVPGCGADAPPRHARGRYVCPLPAGSIHVRCSGRISVKWHPPLVVQGNTVGAVHIQTPPGFHAFCKCPVGAAARCFAWRHEGGCGGNFYQIPRFYRLHFCSMGPCFCTPRPRYSRRLRMVLRSRPARCLPR
jgi:hypothetical protein